MKMSLANCFEKMESVACPIWYQNTINQSQLTHTGIGQEHTNTWGNKIDNPGIDSKSKTGLQVFDSLQRNCTL